MEKIAVPTLYQDFYAKPNESLYNHTKHLLENLETLKHKVSEEDFKLIALSCLYHDIGKMNPHFQARVKAEKTLRFDETKEIGHNVLSYCLAKSLLKGVLDKEERNIVLYAILNHHHYVNNREVLETKGALIEDNMADLLPLFELKKPKQVVTIRQLETLRTLSMRQDKQAVLVKGFLHKCDYSASAHLPAEIENTDLLERLANLNYQWNNMQSFAKAHSEENLIIIGSTGLGKTEASLLWQGNHKGFYVLPLRTAINSMYDRLKKQLYQSDFDAYLGLLHSETRNVYLENEQTSEDEVAEDYYEKTKHLTLPLTICTPDQLFRFVFRYPGYELFLATLSYSKVVIDEIQAYSPDLLAALIYGLQMLVKFGGKFAITTATLPPFIRNFLLKGSETAMPWQEAVFLKEEVRHRVSLEDESLTAEAIASFYQKEKTESRKILVVVNTVKKAQAIYRALNDILEDSHCCICLLHSKFTVADRTLKEKQIKEDGAFACKKEVIWVATQVVEASLDIDFDYLFTEYSDLSSLFQRMGRCNRKGKKEGVEANVFVYLQIEKGLICKSSSRQASGKKGFIYQSLHELGKQALLKWQGENKSIELSEEDKLKMIDTAYTYEAICDYEAGLSGEVCKFIHDYEKKYHQLQALISGEFSQEDANREFRNILSCRAIPKAYYEENYDDFIAIEEKITALKEEIRKAQEEKARKQYRKAVLALQNEVMQYTLSVEDYRVDRQKTLFDKASKLYVCKREYRYSPELGLYFDDSAQDNTEPLIW